MCMGSCFSVDWNPTEAAQVILLMSVDMRHYLVGTVRGQPVCLFGDTFSLFAVPQKRFRPLMEHSSIVYLQS